MDELTRFARRLVEQLDESGDGVHRPVPIGALRKTVMPYRSHRKALGVDSVEDYETVLMRLVAGERGFIKTMPPEAAERCRKELAQANPDLALLDELADSTVQLTSMAAAQIVSADLDVVIAKDTLANTPPSPPPSPAPARKEPEPPPPEEPPAMSAKPATATSATSCSECSKPLPGAREVVFCPWCGHRVKPFTCPRCHTELASEWVHCITCGSPVKDPYRFG